MKDSAQRFTDRVADYQKYRPTYPREIIDLLTRRIGLRPDDVVADIGSGTGFSAEPFLRNGNTVFGVEPNEAMRRAAEQYLSSCKNYFSINGTAEATTLSERSIDVIVAGQAFHWFDAGKAKIEFARIAKKEAHCVLLWSDRQVSSPFMQAYEQFLHEFAVDFSAVDHKRRTDEIIDDFYKPHRVEKAAIPNSQRFDMEGLKGRNCSASYMPGRDHAGFSGVMTALEEMFDRYQHNGTVFFELETRIYWGRYGNR